MFLCCGRHWDKRRCSPTLWPLWNAARIWSIFFTGHPFVFFHGIRQYRLRWRRDHYYERCGGSLQKSQCLRFYHAAAGAVWYCCWRARAASLGYVFLCYTVWVSMTVYLRETVSRRSLWNYWILEWISINFFYSVTDIFACQRYFIFQVVKGNGYP